MNSSRYILLPAILQTCPTDCPFILSRIPGASFHPEQARRRFEAWLTGMREEAAGLLRGGGQGVEESARAREPEEVSISDEVGKLQRSVGDLQQQLGQHDQDVRGWLGAVDKRLEAIIDADTGTMGKQDFLVAMLMAMRSEGFDTPRQACVLPPWNFAQTYGLSEHEQTTEVWVKRLDEWREDDFKQGKGVFRKKKHLFLLCAHTHRLVPCGPKGQGYDIQQLRTWVRKSVSATAFALQVVCSTLAAMAAAPLAAAPLAAAGVEATVSEALGSLQSKLEGLTLDEDNGVNTDHQVTNIRIVNAQLRVVYKFDSHLVSHGTPPSSNRAILKLDFRCNWHSKYPAHHCPLFDP